MKKMGPGPVARRSAAKKTGPTIMTEAEAQKASKIADMEVTITASAKPKKEVITTKKDDMRAGNVERVVSRTDLSSDLKFNREKGSSITRTLGGVTTRKTYTGENTVEKDGPFKHNIFPYRTESVSFNKKKK